MKHCRILTSMNMLVIRPFSICLALGIILISGTGFGPDSTEAV